MNLIPSMDTTNSVSSLRRKTPTKRRKADNKRNPIKVVYISNPMKVSAGTAAEFRALVQELTGKDAESPPDPSRFQDSGSDDSGSVVSGGGGDQTDSCKAKNGDDENDGSTTSDGTGMAQVEAEDYYKWEEVQIGSSTMEWFEAFDDVDVFTTQISAFYESSQS